MTERSRPDPAPSRPAGRRQPVAHGAKIIASGLTATTILGLTAVYGWTAGAEGSAATAPAPVTGPVTPGVAAPDAQPAQPAPASPAAAETQPDPAGQPAPIVIAIPVPVPVPAAHNTVPAAQAAPAAPPQQQTPVAASSGS